MTPNQSDADPEIAVTVERRGHLLLMGLNRPAKRNAFNLAMIDQLARAYYEVETDDDVRCGVLFAHGDHFTGGLDLVEVGPLIREGRLDFSGPGYRDPWRKDAVWTTPVVAAVQGWVMTLAIELLLAADIRIAASNSRFAQMEINRGIYAFGGATIRLPRDAGWGNAMRWLLTGEEYDAAEAYRIGLVQEVVDPGRSSIARSSWPTRSRPSQRRSASRRRWRRRIVRGPKARRQRSPGSSRTWRSCSRARTAAKGCSRSSSGARRGSRAGSPAGPEAPLNSSARS